VMDLRGMGWEGVDRINMAQDRGLRRPLVNTGSIKGGEFLD
jgi:hypothetical protein